MNDDNTNNNQNGPKKVQLTQEGLEELQAELQELKEVKLPAVIDRVAVARSHGDLSENAEYTDAKEEQNFVETRISEIEDVLDRAEVVKQTRSKTTIGIGSTVVVHLKEKPKKSKTFHIVGEYESDPTEGKISITSPIGKALMGKKRGQEVTVTVPAGEVIYVIDEIK